MPLVSVKRLGGYISSKSGEKLKIMKVQWHSLAKESKVNFNAVEAIKPQTGNKATAILFLQPRRYVGLGGQRHAPAALPPGRKIVTDCKGFCLGRMDGLDGCGKLRTYGDSIPYHPAIRGYATTAHDIYRCDIHINFNKDILVSSHLIAGKKNAHIWISLLLRHKIREILRSIIYVRVECLSTTSN
jgi:hypothetical protein